MKTVGYGCLTIIGLIVLFYVLGKATNHDDERRAQAVASEPPETDHDHLLRETKRTATYAATEAIKDFLKAPSQAKFSNRELLQIEDNFALVQTTVDAPNSYGVMLRQTWCAIVRFEPPRGDRFAWNKKVGAWDCTGGIDRDALLTREMLSGWPSATEELAGRAKAGPTKKRRRRVDEYDDSGN